MPLNTLGAGCCVVSDAFTELLEHASVLSERFPLICVMSQKVWVPGPAVEVCDRLWHPWAVSTAQYHPHGLQFWKIWWRVSEKLPEKYSGLGLANIKHSIITKSMWVYTHCMCVVMWMFIYMYVGACGGGHQVSPWVPLNFYFWTQCLSLNLRVTWARLTGWWVPRNYLSLISPQHWGSKWVPLCLSLSVLWRFKLRSSCLSGRHFTRWVIPQGPKY